MQGCASGMMGQEPVELSAGLVQLKSEHPPLLKTLSELLDRCKEVETSDKRKTTYQQLAEDVKSFADRLEFHSSREEDYLFRTMETYLGKGMGPIVVMEYEHEQAKGFIGNFLESAKKELTDEQMLANLALVRNAQATLVSHFAKEEQVLYPMAERILTDEDKAELEEKLRVE